MTKLLLKYRADPNIQQADGDTPLHTAVFKSDITMVELLVKFKADPNISNFKF